MEPLSATSLHPCMIHTAPLLLNRHLVSVRYRAPNTWLNSSIYSHYIDPPTIHTLAEYFTRVQCSIIDIRSRVTSIKIHKRLYCLVQLICHIIHPSTCRLLHLVPFTRTIRGYFGIPHIVGWISSKRNFLYKQSNLLSLAYPIYRIYCTRECI